MVGTLPDRRRTPYDDVEDPLLLEQVPDDHAPEQRRRLPAHIARLDADCLSASEIHLDFECGLVGGLDLRAVDALDVAKDSLDSSAWSATPRLLVDTHDDLVVLLLQHVLDALLRVGQYVARDV